jgi:hypothetical protein
MRHPNLLIFGSENDGHVQSVLSKLNRITVPYVCRFSEFANNFAASVQLKENCTSINLRHRDGTTISLDRLEAVWWWRPGSFSISKDSALSEHLFLEFSHFWTGLLSVLPENTRCYNHFHAESLVSSKLYQLKTAMECGLKVPETLIASDPTAARKFSREHKQVVFKALHASESLWRPTQLLTRELVAQLDAVYSSPVIFQEYIDGDFEYRVTLIDDVVHSVVFDVSHASYRYDARVDASLPRRQIELPQSVTEPLKRFMSASGLRYGAFELKESKNGKLFFLEVNPSGEFLFLDLTAGTRIAESLAGALSATKASPIPDQQVEENIPIDCDPGKHFLLCTPEISRRLL